MLHMTRCLQFARRFMLVSPVLVGCGSHVNSMSQLSVYGGVPTTKGSWSNVVALTEGKNGIFCSATAITPELVITAGHCAFDITLSKVAIYTGNGKEGGLVQGQFPIRSIQAAPGYDNRAGDSANDIAYAVLKDPLDVPARAFVPVLVDPSEASEVLAVGKSATVVGFGERDDGGFGVKYQVVAPISKVNDLEVSIGGRGKDSCAGDSGGPVFGKLSNGDWRVYGVTSRGDRCGTGGIYGIMSANICWIQEDSGIDLGLPSGSC